MVDGRGLDKFMMKTGVVMGEVRKHGDKREKGGRRRGSFLP